MKPETLEVYKKYRLYLRILDNGGHPLFFVDDTTLDYEKFFESYNYGIYLHHQIKQVWSNFKRRRNQMIKKFERGKIHILLRSHLCYDLREEIIKYLM